VLLLRLELSQPKPKNQNTPSLGATGRYKCMQLETWIEPMYLVD
jgi:hypothetical protein